MTNTPRRISACIDPEAMAAFLDARVSAADRTQIEAHIAECEACYDVFAETAAMSREAGERPTRTPRWRWYTGAALAAMLLLIVWTSPTWRGRAPGSGTLNPLVEAVGTNRFIEARLSAEFAWGPPPSPLRGSTSKPTVAVQRAALDLQERAERERTSMTLHHAGVGHLAVGNLSDALPLLEEAVRLAPEAIEPRVDLAAALLARWSEDRVMHGATRALSEAEIAAQRRPDFPPALFNRALALEALGMREPAVRAWDAYLRLDSTSRWAEEARARRDKLLAQRPAVERQDSEVSTAYRDAEEVLLPEWSAAVLAGREVSVQALEKFRERVLAIGADRQLLDDVEAVLEVSRAPVPAQKLAAAALTARGEWHRHYRNGRHQLALDHAQRWLDLARASSLPVLPAHVALGLTELSLGQSQDAAARMLRIRPLLDQRQYWRGVGRVHNALGILKMQNADFSGSVAEYHKAFVAAERARDLELMSVLDALIGESMAEQGDAVTAWRHTARAVSRLELVSSPRARFGVLGSAATIAGDQSAGAAYRFAEELLLSTRDWANAGGQVLAHLQRATAAARVTDPETARRDLAAAADWLTKITDANLAAQFQTEIDIAEARVLATTDRNRAHGAATRALNTLERRGNFYRSASLLLLRGRIAAHAGDIESAEEDWEHGARLIEDQRDTILDEQLRISRLDHVWELFAELLTVQSGRPVKALETLERRHGRELLANVGKAGQEREPLAGEQMFAWLPPDVSVLTYAVLPERLLVWIVTNAGPQLVVRDTPEPRLRELVAAYRAELLGGASDSAAQRLAAELIPEGLDLSPARRLVIIPDGMLHQVSFASLPLPGQAGFLIQRSTVLMAPSLSVLKVAGTAVRQHDTALLIADGRPQPHAGLPALPDAVSEIRALQPLYRNATALLDAAATSSTILAALPRAGVVHIAAHSIVDRAHPALSRLVLGSDQSTPLNAATIAKTRLQPGTIVMLSSCESAEGRTFHGEGALSLGRAFLAAGAANVIGALWPIPDAGSSTLAVKLHTRLATAPAPQALALVQRELIAAGRPRAEWGAFVVFGGLN